MSLTDTTSQLTKKMKRSKRRSPWSKLAQQHGVSTRTLDRWADDGIVPKPEIINGRKYGDPDAPPRLDMRNRKTLPRRDAGSGLFSKTA
jgi:hypothetical protein